MDVRKDINFFKNGKNGFKMDTFAKNGFITLFMVVEYFLIHCYYYTDGYFYKKSKMAKKWFQNGQTQ